MSEGPTIPVGGLPDGVIARPVLRPDGTVPVDRKGRTKTDKVMLLADPRRSLVLPGQQVPDVADKDVRWAVAAATRQWTSIQQKFAGQAPTVLAALARAGVVTVQATVTAGLSIGNYQSWVATRPWRTWHETLISATQEAGDSWSDRAHRAAGTIAELDGGLADALYNARGGDTLLPVLIYAAEDLADDLTHDGPRAFSQTHFEHTKERGDVAQILLNAGASPNTLIALGLRRSPYIGLGGPLHLPGAPDSPTVDLCRFAGPVQFRADDSAVQPEFSRPAPLLLVENLQAAEAVCDRYLDVAVLWFAGQPSDHTLRHIKRLVCRADKVFLATDADLGGVRITARILAALPQRAEDVQVIDVGQHPHRPREPFRPATLDALAGYAHNAGPTARFARAVLERGYPIEQEATIRAALNATLTR